MHNYFNYYIQNDSNKYCYFDDNGLYVEGEVRTPINTPDGWMDKIVEHTRSKANEGVFTSYADSLRFVGEGAKLLRHIRYKIGKNDFFLLIEKVNEVTLQFERYSKMQIDFSKFVDKPDWVDVRMKDSGVANQIGAVESTDFEIPINSNPYKELVRMDGLTLAASARFIIPEQEIGRYGTPIMVKVSQDGELEDMGYKDQDKTGDTNPYPLPYQNGNWFFRNGRTLTNEGGVFNEYRNQVFVTFSGSITYSTAARYRCVLYCKAFNLPIIEDRVIVIDDMLGTTSSSSNPVYVTINYSVSYNIMSTSDNIDRGVSLAFEPYFAPQGFESIKIKESSLSLKYNYKNQPTYIEAVPAYRVWEQLIAKATNNKAVGIASWLENKWGGLMLTSGNALRGLSNSFIKTSIKKFYESLNVPTCCGYKVLPAINNVILTSKHDFYFENLTLTRQDAVSEPEIVFDESEEFGSLEFGYANADIRDVNGRYEFNNTINFNVVNTSSKNKLSIVSDYISGMYAIEYARIAFKGKDTTDNPVDEKVYLISCEKTPKQTQTINGVITHRVLNRPPIISSNGIYDVESAFNYDISPKRSLILEHSRFICSKFNGDSGSIIQYASTNTVEDVIINYGNGLVIQEKKNINVRPSVLAFVDYDTVSNPVYVPFNATIKTGVPIDYMQLLVFPYLKVEFDYNGIILDGFITKTSANPIGNDSKVWTFKLSAKGFLNNRDKLINR